MADIVHAETQSPTREGSYVDWNCALAGSILAAALSFVLFTFGSAIGLSMVSPWTGSGVSGTTFALLTALWAVLVQVASYAAGGYVAGRMRRPWRDAKRDEAEFRDGTHGAVVWATGAVITAFLLAWTAAGATRTAVEAGSAAARTAATSSTDPMTYAVDTLFRSPATAPGAAGAPGATPSSPTTGTASTGTAAGSSAEDMKTEAARVLAASATRGEITPADRAHLARLVSARTGMSQADAEQRVNQVIASTKEAADKARKVGIVAAFLTAASLLAGLAAAWTGARLGGTHRDEGLIWRGFARRTVTPSPRP